MAAKSKSMCCGCRNNFYNGNNPYGIKECWSFPSATVEKRIVVGVWQGPPYKDEPTDHLSCFKPERAVAVNPNALDSDGFWKH